MPDSLQPSRQLTEAESTLDAALLAVFANAAIGVGIVSIDERFLRANAALERFLGYSAGGLTGVRISAVTHADDYSVDSQEYERLLSRELDTYQLDKRYVRKDGSIVWGRLNASLVRAVDGSVMYGLGMIEDINQQRLVRDQLNDSVRQLQLVNRRLSLYLERSPLACIVWDANRRVVEWNPVAVQIFGYSAAEAIGQDIYELTSTPEGMALINENRERFARGEPFQETLSLENRHKDGTRIQCEWHFTVIGAPSDTVNGIVAFAIDITARLRSEQERRMLEANLRHAQKMQSLGTLAGGIAHDFNNILLAIAGNTHLAMEELPPEHPVQLSLNEVHKASARASSIVNQILLFSRREEESAHGAVDLCVLIEESLNLLRATLPARISLSTQLSSSPSMVLGDSAQLHQVLLNLAMNASQAIGEQGGLLSIALSQVVVGALAGEIPVSGLVSGNYLRVSVTDSGAGMTPAIVQRMFEPFFTTKPRGQGTGLGLSVVHGIITSHGGVIAVDTAPGQGSTFHVYLPVLLQQSILPPAIVHRTYEGHGQHILYLDDEEALVYLLTRVLQRLGYQVTAFTDPHAALTAFRDQPQQFDAVVTDLAMPGLSGIQFAREVRAVRRDLPIVMTSGFVRNEDREQALAAGVRELVLKPNTVDALGEILHRLLLGVKAGQSNYDSAKSGSKMTN